MFKNKSVVYFRPLTETDTMCFACSRLVIPDPESVEKTKNDVSECSKFMFVSLPVIQKNNNFTIEHARELLRNAEQNNVKFLKIHYLETDHTSYRPYTIDLVDCVKDPDVSPDPNLITDLAFMGYYQLRLAAIQLVDVLERVAEKKRRRRLQYKCNKREKKEKNDAT